MMSGKGVKKKELPATSTDVYDLEQQFVLRLPSDAAAMLHEDLKDTSTVQLKDKLSIEMDPDMRHGRVRYGPDIFFAKLLDLPSIIESLKTLDKKTFYKTSDVCQMLVCKTEEDWTQDENESPRKKDKDKKYAWNHGLTLPLKNVRKRRFRKTLKKKYMEQPEIEKEVKRLFRYDAEAIDVKYEIIVDDEKSLSDSGTSQTLDASASVSTSQAHLTRTETSASMDVASFFGELSSSEEEEEEDKDVNIMDSGEDESRGPTTPRRNFDQSMSESQDTGMNDTVTAELQEKLKELVKQLEEIRERRSHQEDQLATQEEDTLKDEMQEAFNKLVQEENEKERELEILSAMLNQ
ncbi:transcription initiation factor TFIID subunit 7 [Aplysia californica]|uniref:Transcription initiation factor TFIID subunit 7 n=1 Tax=Aplysia californica TaxID=6500 RepID=A0ABM1VWU1_APLCA|nr:transcription initiation factor TFIID subunit 7 [Aplysia californica]XP_005103085.1 transcription initiation factor TFIID subunit 7 [Aplysia californica]XP_035826883.1 transcription initiation factor TFIID subunit 7 [Aplysia californica]